MFRINVTERKGLLKRRQFKSDKVDSSQGSKNAIIKNVSHQSLNVFLSKLKLNPNSNELSVLIQMFNGITFGFLLYTLIIKYPRKCPRIVRTV